MYLIEDNVMTPERASKIIQSFETKDKPRLTKYKNYYDGIQAIANKTVTDVGKPCNKIVTNFCYAITGNYLGYLTGMPIAYTGKNMEAIQDILYYNDVKTEDSSLLKNALIYGVAYEVNYLDSDGNQRFKTLSSSECIPVYSNSLDKELLFVIRYFIKDSLDPTKGYLVQIYSQEDIKNYSMSSIFAELKFIDDDPHFYNQVPITVFPLNSEEISIFDKVMSLQDAYNTLLSSEVDDFQSFCDAYLVLKGVQADLEDLTAMKENRVLLLAPDADASYLNKSITDTQIENMLNNIKDNIEKIANSPDFASDAFGTSSGIAIRYRLLGMENTASSIVANMTMALQKRIELISNIINLSGEATWRDVSITFTRNIPVNEVEIASVISSLKGIVSDKTLLSQLSFISDVDKELELLKEQAPLTPIV